MSQLISDKIIKPSEYRQSTKRSILAVVLSFLSYFAISTALYYSSNVLLSFGLVVLLALVVVRIFIIQHDCGHKSLFKSARANNYIGLLCSLFTWTPYQYWRKMHNYHHRHAGREGETDIGGVILLTLGEYKNSSALNKFLYRLFRSTWFLLLIIPLFVYGVAYRVPTSIGNFTRSAPNIDKSDFRAMAYLDVWIVLFCLGTLFSLGSSFLLFYLLGFYLAIISGVALFYIQHNYEETYLVPEKTWTFNQAALQGSSLFVPPKWLAWFIGNIGFHHIHHLNPRIPFYRLKEIHNNHVADFAVVKVLYWTDVLKQFSYKLYDESNRKMISWRAYRALSKLNPGTQKADMLQTEDFSNDMTELLD